MLHSSHSKSCGRHSDSWHIFLFKMSLSFSCLCQVALSLLVISILSSMSSQAAFKIGMENRHTSLKYHNTSSMNTWVIFPCKQQVLLWFSLASKHMRNGRTPSTAWLATRALFLRTLVLIRNLQARNKCRCGSSKRSVASFSAIVLLFSCFLFVRLEFLCILLLM